MLFVNILAAWKGACNAYRQGFRVCKGTACTAP